MFRTVEKLFWGKNGYSGYIMRQRPIANYLGAQSQPDPGFVLTLCAGIKKKKQQQQDI